MKVSSILRRKLPEKVFRFIDEKSILSGGFLVKTLMEIFPCDSTQKTKEKDETIKLIREIQRLTGYFFDYIGPNQDVDIYTSLSPLTVADYFGVKELDGEYREQYMSYVMKFKVSGVSVDVIFPGILGSNTEDFIQKEFDLDICKFWFNGKNLYWNGDALLKLERREFSFTRPKSNITKETDFGIVKRIIKYRARGFSLISSDDILKEFLHY